MESWTITAMSKIRELQKKYGLAVLMTEQNFKQAIKIADLGYILVQGKISFEGKTAEDLGENELIKKYYLGV
jgi:branched-chain amino acid transport system ATP-binding protein